MATSLTLTTSRLRVIYFGGDSVKDAAGYIDGKTGSMMATNMDDHKHSELYELVCPAATGAFSGLHDSAASDSGKMKKAARHTPHRHATKETVTPKQARTNAGIWKKIPPSVWMHYR